MEWSQEGIVTGLREQDPAAVRDWVTPVYPQHPAGRHVLSER